MTYRLADSPNAYGCYDPQCLDSTWDHECPVVPAANFKELAAAAAAAHIAGEAALRANLSARAIAADNEPPLLFATDDIVDKWVLVPREHLRTMQRWYGEIDETDAIMMCAEILADARLLGRLSQHPEYIAWTTGSPRRNG